MKKQPMSDMLIVFIISNLSLIWVVFVVWSIIIIIIIINEFHGWKNVLCCIMVRVLARKLMASDHENKLNIFIIVAATVKSNWLKYCCFAFNALNYTLADHW